MIVIDLGAVLLIAILFFAVQILAVVSVCLEQ